MIRYEVKDTTMLTHDVVQLTLQPSNGAERLEFTAGQYAAIGFREGGRPTPMRCFSIVSSPKDADLRFAMRVDGRFTTAANLLRPGDEVRVTGPYGQFVIEPDHDRNIVMFGGGIGATPFISMLRYATQLRMPIPITLCYSCRSQEDIPFMQELLMIERQNPLVKVYFFVSDGKVQQTSAGTFVPGRISEEKVAQFCGSWRDDSTYFICGSKGFRRSMEKMLLAHANEDQIVIESFTQATKLGFGGKLSLTSLTYGLTAAALVLGTGFIMSLDLARAVPKLASAQPKTTTSQSTTAPALSPSTSSNSSSSETPSTTTPSTDTTSTNSTPPTTNTPPPPPQQSYYQPVTSVS